MFLGRRSFQTATAREWSAGVPGGVWVCASGGGGRDLLGASSCKGGLPRSRSLLLCDLGKGRRGGRRGRAEGGRKGERREVRKERSRPKTCLCACPVTNLFLTLCDWSHGLYPARPLCPWDFPGKNTGVGCRFLLQRIFPIQGSDQTRVSCVFCTGRWILDHWATGKPQYCLQLCANWGSIQANHLLFLCFGSPICSKDVIYIRESNDLTPVIIKEKFNNTKELEKEDIGR